MELAMRRFGHCVSLALVLLPSLALANGSADCRVTARFSSQGSIAKPLVEAISDAERELTLALYGFDNPELGAELLKLVRRNVIVRLKIDTARNAGKRIAKFIEDLQAGGVQVQTVTPNGRNHNKFAVIDGTRVVTGSYNWTLRSEGSWENLLILDCAELAKAYEAEWERIR
jgi:phosphatidylserine/phosphatidylglycerophosphate/cardiolipin synthase-like enzyme